jgi:predicted nucleic acid-binding protein
MYLFDSDVIIDFLKNIHPGIDLVRQALERISFISVISWSEVIYGLRKSDHKEARLNQFANFIQGFEIEVLPVNTSVAEKYIDLKLKLGKERKPLADFDLFIAATAISNNLVLVTRNKRHFSRIKGLRLS